MVTVLPGPRLENDRAGGFGGVDRVDRAAGLGRARIAGGGHDDGQCRIVRESGRGQRGQPSLGHRQHHRQQIALEAQHQHLTFRIAEARIIFDQLRPLFGQHQPGIEHA